MINCPKCKTELTEKSIRIEQKPCDHCPSGYSTTVFCAKCGTNVISVKGVIDLLLKIEIEKLRPKEEDKNK